MIYLDTHIVVWLYAGLLEKFNQPVVDLMNELDIVITPIVRLELQYLHEINKITSDPDTITSDLSTRIGLKVSTVDFNDVVSEALGIPWTRDPFDRIIVATASLGEHLLVSKDQNILGNYLHARW